MRGRVEFNAQWCRTCKVCEVVCSIAKEGRAQPALARINVFFDEFSTTDPITANVCAQCPGAPCVDACPVDAMRQDNCTGVVVVDDEACIGCMKCREACPWDVPKKHPDNNIAVKCDLCADRDEGPLCVRMCPLSGKALSYVRLEGTVAE